MRNKLIKMKQFDKYSGPSMIGYYYHLETGKRIVIMGDIHYAKEGGCGKNFKNVTQYLDYIFKAYPNIQFDLFSEIPVPKSYRLRHVQTEKYATYGSEMDYIGELFDYALKYYKKLPNARLHFTDIRYDKRKEAVGRALDIFFEFEAVMQLMSVSVYPNGTNLKEIYDSFAENLNNFLYSARSIIADLKIIKQMNMYSSKILLKELRKARAKNERYYEAISRVSLALIDDYLLNAIDSDPIPYTYSSKNKNAINNIYLLFMKALDASASVADTYLVSRIMKSDEFQNNILYVGKQHFKIINTMLEGIGFKTVYINDFEENENYRCVDNDYVLHEFLTRDLEWINETIVDL